MTTIEYLALPWYKRVFHKIKAFFVSIPLFFIELFARKIPNTFSKIGKNIAGFFNNLINAFTHGDYKTKISFFIMGFGQISRGSIIRGLLNLIYQVAFIIFFIAIGIPNLLQLGTFGSIAESTYEHPIKGIAIYKYTDDSFLILLFSIISIILLFIYFFLWYKQVNESVAIQNLNRIGRKVSDKLVLSDLVGKNYHMVLLSFPTFGLVIFTIIPLIFMILVAFTNFSSTYQNPKELFDWVGTYNFNKLLGMGANGNQVVAVFLQILLWTLIWAFFATFTNYFLGMGVALLINKKGIKLKKLWRTALITTIAVPQFISLLFMKKFLDTDLGALNYILKSAGIINQNIPFLNDSNGGIITKITIIIVNMWIGIPYTMLMCSGILMNVPQDLYESAKIDGASPFKMYMKITLPYMLFVTGPYLISNFVGNINNFNVIYLLSGGGPVFIQVNGMPITTSVYEAGQTDLLITWLYKIAMTNVTKDYGLASVIGIFVFIVVASFSLILYGKSNAVKNEGDFQ